MGGFRVEGDRMRYRIGEGLEQAATSTDSFIIGSVVLGLLIGAVLVWTGLHGRQYWIVWWGGTLVVASVVYLGAAALGLTG